GIDVLGAKLGRHIYVPHLRDWCHWRVVIGEPLEEWASVHHFWRLHRKPCYPTPISKDNEATDSTDEIRFGFPCDLIAVICVSVRSYIDGSGGAPASLTVPVLTYSIQIFAVASFGNHAALLGSPLNSAAGMAVSPNGVASHAELRSTGLKILLHSVKRIWR